MRRIRCSHIWRKARCNRLRTLRCWRNVSSVRMRTMWARRFRATNRRASPARHNARKDRAATPSCSISRTVTSSASVTPTWRRPRPRRCLSTHGSTVTTSKPNSSKSEIRGRPGQMKPRKWKTLKSDVAYSTPIFDLHRRRSTHARRGERDFFILEAPNWVNIIPLAKNGDVVMIRQWRHGISEFTLEVPGGMVDPEDPSPMDAARREMIEETGFDSDAIVALGKVHPNPAIQGNICFSFLAENVRQVERVVSAGDEETEVELVPMREIRGLIASGKVMHALTIAAFSLLHVYNTPPKRPRKKYPRPFADLCLC